MSSNLENLPNTEKEKVEEEKILTELTEISSALKKLTKRDEKIQILIKLNEFLKENKEIIKEKFPSKLTSILNSL